MRAHTHWKTIINAFIIFPGNVSGGAPGLGLEFLRHSVEKICAGFTREQAHLLLLLLLVLDD